MITPAMLRRGIIPQTRTTTDGVTAAQAHTALAELLTVGFIADPQELQQLSLEELVTLITQAGTTIGANRTWQPMFPGFPEQVATMPDIELFLTQIYHYLTYGRWRPDIEKAFEHTKLAHTDWTQNFQRLTLAQLTPQLVQDEWAKAVALSLADREFLHDVIAELGINVPELMATTGFTSGDNFAAALCEIPHPHERLDAGLTLARTATDVLRTVLAAYCKEPDRAVDLLSSAEFRLDMRSIPRPQRRSILRALARFADNTNLDMVMRHKKLWRRALRPVHPFELPQAAEVHTHLTIIFGKTAHRTFNSQVEAALLRNDVPAAARLLATNPGNLLRRVDHLMRLSRSKKPFADALLSTLAEAAPKARLTTLISCYNGISNRDAPIKVFRIRGRNVLKETSNPPVESWLKSAVLDTLTAAMQHRLRAAPAPTEPVSAGSTVPVELVRREASTSKLALARGQRLPLGDGSIMRLFVHWYGRDVDLGVCFADALLMEQLCYLDYTNLSSNQLKQSVLHSGDIVYAPLPDGACEFVDIKDTIWQKLPTVRYAIPQLISYTGDRFDVIDNVAGIMIRSQAMAGEIFEPRTVETAMNVCAKSTSAIPFIVDLVDRELIWLDTSLGSRMGCFNSGRSNGVQLIRAELETLNHMLTNGQLLALWAAAHDAETTPDAGDEPTNHDQVAKLLAF